MPLSSPRARRSSRRRRKVSASATKRPWPSGTKRPSPPRGRGQQLLQVHHHGIVQLDFGLGVEPAAVALQRHAHGARAHHHGRVEAAPLGPLHIHLVLHGIQLQQQGHAALGVIDHPVGQAFVQRQGRQGGAQGLGRPGLRLEVAAHQELLAPPLHEQAGAARAGALVAEALQRLHPQLGLQPLVEGHQEEVETAVAGHLDHARLAGRLVADDHLGVHRHHGRNGAEGLEYLGFRLGGHAQAPAQDLRQLAVGRRDGDDAHAARTVLGHHHIVLTQGRLQAQLQHVPVAEDPQLGLPRRHLHALGLVHLALAPEDHGVAHEGLERPLEVQLNPLPALADAADQRLVLGQEEFHEAPLVLQALHADGLAAPPGAPGVHPLLAGLQRVGHAGIGVPPDPPGQAARTLVGLGLHDRVQRLQRLLPALGVLDEIQEGEGGARQRAAGTASHLAQLALEEAQGQGRQPFGRRFAGRGLQADLHEVATDEFHGPGKALQARTGPPVQVLGLAGQVQQQVLERLVEGAPRGRPPGGGPAAPGAPRPCAGLPRRLCP